MPVKAAPTLTALQRRIEARTERLRGVGRKTPRTENGIRAELSKLGPYVPGERQAVSRRRALLQLALKPWLGRGPGLYGNTTAPETVSAAREELLSLGLHVVGEPGVRSRRRAFLVAFIATAERPEQGRSGGFYNEPTDLPTDRAQLQSILNELGPYILGEPGRKSRYRAAVRRALHPDVALEVAPTLTDPSLLGTEGVMAELQRLGPYIPGERRWVTLRRAACERRAAVLSIPGYGKKHIRISENV